jgi:hypothetical protein
VIEARSVAPQAIDRHTSLRCFATKQSRSEHRNHQIPTAVRSERIAFVRVVSF